MAIVAINAIIAINTPIRLCSAIKIPISMIKIAEAIANPKNGN